MSIHTTAIQMQCMHTPIISISPFYFQGNIYQQIGPNGTLCYKTNQLPNYCHTTTITISTRSACECECNQHAWCIGYSHRVPGYRKCLLFTSIITECPGGYTLYSGPLVLSIDQFTGEPNDAYSGCYGKITGTNKIWMDV